MVPTAGVMTPAQPEKSIAAKINTVIEITVLFFIRHSPLVYGLQVPSPCCLFSILMANHIRSFKSDSPVQEVVP